MSKIKSPQEKKEKSLQLDRRNTYGENDKSSRKNIPKSKQIQHQAERHAANQVLAHASERMSDADFTSLELEAETAAKADRLKGFKKFADEPLGKVIKKQQVYRALADKKVKP